MLLLCVGAAGATSVSARSARPSQVRVWHGVRVRAVDPRVGTGAGDGVGRVVAAVSGSLVGAASTAPGGAHRRDEVLSNERTFSRWAYPDRLAPVYRAPRLSAGRVARLHWDTEDGFPEVYLLLRAHWDRQGREWVLLRVPMRPNGITGWVRRDALDQFHLTRLSLVVDRQRLRISLYSSGRLRWRAPVGVGKGVSPTPAGRFWIREEFKILDPRSGYWPYAFGTADYSTLTDWPGGGIVGIHGPYYEAQLIPGRISHGCIRLRVTDDAWLGAHIGVGTPLRVI